MSEIRRIRERGHYRCIIRMSPVLLTSDLIIVDKV